MRTTYTNQSSLPAPPAFVAESRRHLEAARALDNTPQDHDPRPGAVSSFSDTFSVELAPGDTPGAYKFFWFQKTGPSEESECFRIKRTPHEEVHSHELITKSAWSPLSLETLTERVGLHPTSGGLLFEESLSGSLPAN